MNIAEIAETFIRAAEIERSMPGHVGPSRKVGFWPVYVHDFADKAGWRKELGDKLAPGTDLLADERKAFWERLSAMPTPAEIARLETIFEWLTGLDDDRERRALLAWARSKVGGKSFRRWAFQIERIHPETGRRRKDRAIAKIQANLRGWATQHDEKPESSLLHIGTENGDIPGTLAEDAGRREGLNSWAAEDAFSRVFAADVADFSWSRKRNEARRQREAKRRRAEMVAA